MQSTTELNYMFEETRKTNKSQIAKSNYLNDLKFDFKFDFTTYQNVPIGSR